MRTIQFVETTKERYDTHVKRHVDLIFGGRVDISTAEDDQFRQVKVYHNPAISDIGQTPQWVLVAFALENRFKPEHSQFFVFEEVEMGVTHKEV